MHSNSPNSLAERGKIDKAKRVLQSVRGVDDVEVEFQDIIDAVDEVCIISHVPANTNTITP